jgi:hypothetical protein
MTDQTTVMEPAVNGRTAQQGENPVPTEGARRKSVLARISSPSLKLDASTGVWVGLVVAAFGFGLIFYSWIRVAATLDVGRQMPYVVSGAMSGLGLIVVGVALVDMAVRRQDRLERRQQLGLMRNILEELRETSQTSEQKRS